MGFTMKNYEFLKSTAPSAEAGKKRGIQTVFRGLCEFLSAGGGFITEGQNFEITPEGTLRTAALPVKLSTGVGGKPLAFFAQGDMLYAVVRVDEANNVDIFCLFPDGEREAMANLSNTSSLAGQPRSLTVYSDWTGGSDVISGEYEKKLLIFPDKKFLPLDGDWRTVSPMVRYKVTRTVRTETLITESMYGDGDWTQNEDGSYTLSGVPEGVKRDSSFSEQVQPFGYQKDAEKPKDRIHPADISTVYTKIDVYGSDNAYSYTALCVTEKAVTVTERFSLTPDAAAMPEASLAVGHNSRLFGASGARIFASAPGNFVDYDLDTADEYDENNAWYCATSFEDFTAICTYDGRVTLLSPDGLFQIYGSKNPFRVRQINKVGTSFGRTVKETEGILYYANTSGIFAFNGAVPRSVSDGRLDFSHFTGKDACAGAFDGIYYLRRATDFDRNFSCGGTRPCYVYDAARGVWSIQNFTDKEICFFAATEAALYALCEDGSLYSTRGASRDGVSWYAETPVDCGGTADIKRLARLQAVLRFRGRGRFRLSVKLDNGSFFTCGVLDRQDGVYPLYCPVPSGDHVVRSIRFDGTGDIEVMALEQIFTAGGIRLGGF